MPKVCFLGKIFPSVYQLSISLLTVEWRSPDVGLTWQFNIKIENNAVTINCDINRYSGSDFVLTYMRALDAVKAAVNLAAFAYGIGYSVLIDTFIDPEGRQSPIALEDKSLPALCTVLDRTSSSDYGEVFKLVYTEPPLFQALDDLIVSITVPHLSVVNCTRAIEGIRHMIAPGKKNEPAWAKMRQALRISESYLRMLTDHSRGPRHGDRTHIKGDITREIVKRSWVIMNRFLEYRKRGNQPLPESGFPTLA